MNYEIYHERHFEKFNGHKIPIHNIFNMMESSLIYENYNHEGSFIKFSLKPFDEIKYFEGVLELPLKKSSIKTQIKNFVPSINNIKKISAIANCKIIFCDCNDTEIMNCTSVYIKNLCDKIFKSLFCNKFKNHKCSKCSRTSSKYFFCKQCVKYICKNCCKICNKCNQNYCYSCITNLCSPCYVFTKKNTNHNYFTKVIKTTQSQSFKDQMFLGNGNNWLKAAMVEIKEEEPVKIEEVKPIEIKKEYIFDIVPVILQKDLITYYDDYEDTTNNFLYERESTNILDNTFFLKCPLNEISLVDSVSDYINEFY